jgi:hypothetical protein
MSNDENLGPPPLVRQVAGDVVRDPLVAVFDGPREEGRFENGVWVPPDFVPLPNGMDGYTEEDWENVRRNNGWYVEEDSSNEYEQEDFPDSSDSEDEEEGEPDFPRDLPPLLVNNPPHQA